jgi:hypothetical protein
MAARKTRWGVICSGSRYRIAYLRERGADLRLSDEVSIDSSAPALLNLALYAALDPQREIPFDHRDERLVILKTERKAPDSPDEGGTSPYVPPPSLQGSDPQLRRSSPRRNPPSGRQSTRGPDADEIRLVARENRIVTGAVFRRAIIPALPAGGLPKLFDMPPRFETVPPLCRDSVPLARSDRGPGPVWRFLVQPRIGRGGIGDVFAGLELSTGVAAALKVCSAHDALIRREAVFYQAAVEPLGLPTTLRFYGFFQSAHLSLLVLELGPSAIPSFKVLTLPQRSAPRFPVFSRSH